MQTAESNAFEKTSGVLIKASILRDMLKKSIFAMWPKRKKTRYSRENLSGVFVTTSKIGDLRIVASDGRRLTVTDGEATHIRKIPKAGAIIPREAVQRIFEILATQDCNTTKCCLAFKENRCRFDCGSATLTAQLVDASFPDFMSVIPKQRGNSIRVPRREFLSALRHISASSELTRVRLTINSKCMEVVALDDGKANAVKVEVKGREFEEARRVFETRFLVGMLNAVSEDSVVLKFFDDEYSPIIIRPYQNSKYTYLVMPIHL